MADEEIRLWSGSTPPNAFAYWSLQVKDEKHRPARFKEFQEWAFGRDPQFIPLIYLHEFWQHQDKCPITTDMHVADMIVSMIEHFNDTVEWDEEKYPKVVEELKQEEEQEEEPGAS
jgi:hypothetical protein